MILAGVGGCSKEEPVERPSTLSTATPKLSVADIRKLRWLEGTWRGIGTDQPAFYEEYRFADDSTLIAKTFSDSALTKVNEESRYELRDGVMANTGDGPRWMVASVDDSSVQFAPVRASNSFRWTRKDADHWIAVLEFPAREGGKPGRSVTYEMSRWTPPRGR